MEQINQFISEGPSEFFNSLIIGLTPDELLTVSEWADKNRVLSSKSSSEAGRWNTDRTPYLREIMDTLSPQCPTSEVIFIKGTQVGGSETGFNFIGYIIDKCPGPILLVEPTIDLAKKISKQRIEPMIDECPALREKIKTSRSRDSGNTLLSKEFQGGILMIGGANSAASLCSMPIRYLILDDRDRFTLDADGEGDPGDLARARTDTFPRKKIFENSTPTIDGQSGISKSFEISDKRYFHLPCPHCGEYQKLKFDNLRWEKKKPETAVYVCANCGVIIEEHRKTWMLSKGKWIPENPQSKIAGFHLSSLYSPIGWLSWSAIAAQWEKAQGDQEKLKVFINTKLAETWKESADVPEWQRLYERRETYNINSIPSRVLFLTASVDVQGNRLECEIKGWGRNKESWSIDYRVFSGNTAEPDVWKNIDAVLDEFWIHPTAGDIQIKMLAVDSGFNTQSVYDWAKNKPINRVMVVKGSASTSPKSLIESSSTIEINNRGKKIRYGLRLWTIGTMIAKTELYSWLKYNQPTQTEIEESGYPPGYCHYPFYDEHFFQGLTAEQLVTKKIKGFPHYYFEKIRDRNEPLDLHVYNRAAATQLGIDRFNDQMWSKLESEMGVFAASIPVKEEEVAVSANKTASRTVIKPPKKKSSFW